MAAARQRPDAIPSDYDEDPGRFAANRAASRFLATADVHPMVADRLAAEALAPVLDVGGATGVLASLLRKRGRVPTVTLDRAAHVARAPEPAVRADARSLPFRDDTFGAVAALYVLYHLPDPAEALAEARRVVRPGGLIAVCAPSRWNDPELARVLPGWGRPSTFDAEDAPDILASVAGPVETVSWDAPLLTLPDRNALELYLRGRGLSETESRRAAEQLAAPLRLTKRGVLVWGRVGRSRGGLGSTTDP